MDIRTLIFGIVIMIVFYIIKRPRVGLNEPPLVPFTIPIIGHTLSYLFNTKNFIKKCREQYGECFSIYVFGRVMTVVSREFISEVLNNEDFDAISAVCELLPFHQFLPYNGGLCREKVKFHAKTVREQVTAKLDLNNHIVRKYLEKGIDEWIGNCNEPKIIYNAWSMVNSIASLPVANIFAGEEAASHKDLVKTFEDLAFDLGPLLVIPPVLAFIHQKLHEFVITLPIRFGWNPVSRHRKTVMNRLKPVIEKRLKEKAELGDNYKSYNDLLDYYMNLPTFDSTKPNNLHFHVDNLFVMIFGAIATTSKTATNALYELAGRPEILDELYKEALLINKECNGSPTVSDVLKMKKLDSFLKESLRHSDDIVGLPHYVVSKSYTFSNNLIVPRGRSIWLYTDDLLKSKKEYGVDSEEFKPFRFANSDSPATKVDRSFVIFGGGRHACPGRFFAINETKLIFHNLILRYKISTKSGKIDNKLIIGPIAMPPRSGIIFENRK